MLAENRVLAKAGQYCITNESVFKISKPSSDGGYVFTNINNYYIIRTGIPYLTVRGIYNMFDFFKVVTKKEAISIAELSERQYHIYINKLKKNQQLKGKILGHNVRKVDDLYIFGCGSVILSEQEIKETIKIGKKVTNTYKEVINLVHIVTYRPIDFEKIEKEFSNLKKQ